MPDQDKISVSDFAAKIKSKYPEYKDIDDSTLTSKMLEKYPEYKDKVNIEPDKKKEPTTLSPFGESLRSGLSEKPISESTQVKQFREPKQEQVLQTAKENKNQGMNNVTERRLKSKGISYKIGDATFNKEKQEVQKQITSGDLVPTKNRKGEHDYANGIGFWKSTANSFVQGFTGEVEAAKINTIQSEYELAAYLEDLEKKEPDVTDKPTGIRGWAGSMLGGLPKMAGIVAAGEAVDPALGGAIALGADGEWLGMAAKRQELYFKKRDELINNGVNPTDAKITAARDAMRNAPLAALPEAVTNAALAKIGGKSSAELSTSRKILKDFVTKPLIVGAIGGASPIAEYGIEKAQGYDVKLKDALDKSGEGFSDFVLMDLGLHIMMNPLGVSKTAISASKEFLSNSEPEIVQSIASKYPPQQRDKIISQLDSYKKAKNKVSEYTPQDIMHNVAGLQEAIDNGTAKVERLQKDKTTPEVVLRNAEEELNKLKKTQNTILETGKGDIHETDQNTGQPIIEEQPPKEPVILRHGQTEYNTITGTKGEQPETEPLSQKGKADAKIKAADLIQQGIKNIVTSPLTRSRETADIIAKETGGEVTVLPELAEFNPKEESTKQFAERVQSVHDKVKELDKDHAVITHGSVMGMMDALDKANGDIKEAVKIYEEGTKRHGNLEEYKPMTDEQRAKYEESKIQQPTKIEIPAITEISEVKSTASEGKTFAQKDLDRAEAKKVHARVKEMDAPTDAEQVALRYLAEGGKVSQEAVNEIAGTVKRARLNTGERDLKTQEAKDRDYVKGNETLDDLSHRLWELNKQKIPETEIKNALMSAIGDHNTRLEASKSYLERYNPDYAEEQHYAKLAEQYADEHATEEENIRKWLATEGEQRHELENQEEHINQLIKQYETEVKRENQQSTEGSEGQANQEAGSGTSGEEPPPPITPERQAELEAGDIEGTPIKMKLISDAREYFRKVGVSWDTRSESAMKSLADFAGRGGYETLYDAANAKVNEWYANVQKGGFNANVEEVIQMGYYRHATERMMQEQSNRMQSSLEFEQASAIGEFDKLQSNLDKIDAVIGGSGSEAGAAFGLRQGLFKTDSETSLSIAKGQVMKTVNPIVNEIIKAEYNKGDKANMDKVREAEGLKNQAIADVERIHEEEQNINKEIETELQNDANKRFEQRVKEEVEKRLKEFKDKPKKGKLTVEQAKKTADKLRNIADNVENFLKAKGAEGADIQGVSLQKAVADAIRYIADRIEKGDIPELIEQAIKKFVKDDVTERELRDNIGKALIESGIDEKDFKSKEVIRLEKELEDLRRGIVKKINRDRVPTEEEKRLKDEIFEEKKKLGLIPSSVSKLTPTEYDLKITSEEKKIERLEKEKDDLENGIIRQRNVTNLKPTPEQQSKINKLSDEIADMKKNLGLIKPKSLPKKPIEKLTASEKSILRKEKELEDLQKGIVKQKLEKREITDEEKKLNEKIFEEKKKLGLVSSKTKEIPTTDYGLEITPIERIKEIAKNEDTETLTTSMVQKGLINDLINQYIDEGIEPKDVIDKAYNDLKSDLPNIERNDVRDAYLKEGKYQQAPKESLNKERTQKATELKRLEDLTKKLEQLKQDGIAYEDKNNKVSQSIENESAKVKAELERELLKHGIKKETGSSTEKAEKETRAVSHNERVKDLSKKVVDMLNEDGISDAKKEALNKVKEALNKAEISDQKIKSIQDKEQLMAQSIRKILGLLGDSKFKDAVRSEKLEGLKKELEGLTKQFDADKNKSEIKLNTDATTKRLQNEIDAIDRKIKLGEFDDKPKAQKVTSAKIIQLETAKRLKQKEYKKIQQKIQDSNKTWYEKAVEASGTLYLMDLISGWTTTAAVAFSGFTKPLLETVTRGTTGRVAPAIFKNLSYGAGAEGATERYIKQEQARYKAILGRLKPEQVKKNLESFVAKLGEANKEYQQHLDTANEMKSNLGEDNKEYKAFVNDVLTPALNKSNDAMFDTFIPVIQSFIGADSLKDAAEIMLKGASQLEELMGYKTVESFKELSAYDKTVFLLGFMGRSHSVLKNFSARGEFAAGFMARMENRMKKGEDISQASSMLEVANEAMNDYNRGKYQQSNFLNEVFKSMKNGAEKLAEEHPNNKVWGTSSKALNALFKIDFPIAKTPLNILDEAVTEYMFGIVKGGISQLASEYKGAGGFKGLMEVAKGEKSLTELRQQISEHIKNMPPEYKDMILRAYRKGGFVAMLMAVGGLGWIHYGGARTKNSPQKKKEGEKGYEKLPINEQLDYGQLQIGDWKMSKEMSHIFTHSSILYPYLGIIDYLRMRDKELRAGKNEAYSSSKALVNSLSNVIEKIPYTKELNPFAGGFKAPTPVPLGRLTQELQGEGRKGTDWWENMELKIPFMAGNVGYAEGVSKIKNVNAWYNEKRKEARLKGKPQEVINELDSKQEEYIKELKNAETKKEADAVIRKMKMNRQ